MPLGETGEFYGTEKDGSKNTDYCIYCYKDGDFLQDVTMDGMIEHCLQYFEEYNATLPVKLTRDEARAQMKEFFPHLKRWKS